jgi:hypothetical protein
MLCEVQQQKLPTVKATIVYRDAGNEFSELWALGLSRLLATFTLTLILHTS